MSGQEADPPGKVFEKIAAMLVQSGSLRKWDQTHYGRKRSPFRPNYVFGLNRTENKGKHIFADFKSTFHQILDNP